MYPAHVVKRNEIYYVQYILDNSKRFLNNYTAEGQSVKNFAQNLHFYANANSHRRFWCSFIHVSYDVLARFSTALSRKITVQTQWYVRIRSSKETFSEIIAIYLLKFPSAWWLFPCFLHAKLIKWGTFSLTDIQYKKGFLSEFHNNFSTVHVTQFRDVF
jgi:hypothetical protein